MRFKDTPVDRFLKRIDDELLDGGSPCLDRVQHGLCYAMADFFGLSVREGSSSGPT